MVTKWVVAQGGGRGEGCGEGRAESGVHGCGNHLPLARVIGQWALRVTLELHLWREFSRMLYVHNLDMTHNLLRYGMSSRVGWVSLDYEDDGRSISSETRSMVEEEVKALVQVCVWWGEYPVHGGGGGQGAGAGVCPQILNAGIQSSI